MRRWIFAALVLLNLALFIWGVFYVEAERAETPELPPQIAPEKMQLLKKELVRAKAHIARNVEPPTPTPLPVSTGATVSKDCYVLGPLTDLAQAQRIEQALSGRAFHRREEATHAEAGYRVYLPSFTSREEAERKRREITKLGFKDNAVLQEEGFQNALSLGLFSVEENAQARVQALLEKGIPAQLQKLDETRVTYWVQVERVESSADERPQLKDLLGGTAGADVQESTCVTVPALQQ